MRPPDPAARRPGAVPDALDVTGGADTDGDGRPDTVLTDDGVDLLLLTDTDGDGFADQLLRIGADGVVVEHLGGEDPVAGRDSGVLRGLLGGADAGAGA